MPRSASDELAAMRIRFVEIAGLHFPAADKALVAAHVQAFLREIEVSMIAHATWRRSVQPAGCLRRKEKATLAKNTGKPAAKI